MHVFVVIFSIFRNTFYRWHQKKTARWDWPLTWLTNHRPSGLWHCWLGQLTRKIVSEMTYDVLSGTLNTTILYQKKHLTSQCSLNSRYDKPPPPSVRHWPSSPAATTTASTILLLRESGQCPTSTHFRRQMSQQDHCQCLKSHVWWSLNKIWFWV